MNDVIQFLFVFMAIMGGWFLFMGMAASLGGLMEKDEALIKLGTSVSFLGAIFLSLAIASNT